VKRVRAAPRFVSFANVAFEEDEAPGLRAGSHRARSATLSPNGS
jgi:hypothetical protein